jgi:hypothetical protein
MVFAAPHERLLPQKLRLQHANAAFPFVALGIGPYAPFITDISPRAEA